jgi:uncharacterized glyoxalase superfamily protein PhnB
MSIALRIKSKYMESLSPNMYVHDVKSTIEFYQILGFKPVMTVPEDGEAPVWAMLQNGNVTLMMESLKNIEGRLPEISRQLGGSFLLYINIKGIQAFFEEIKDKVTVLSGLEKTFYGATEFVIKDSNGYVLTFAEHE